MYRQRQKYLYAEALKNNDVVVIRGKYGEK